MSKSFRDLRKGKLQNNHRLWEYQGFHFRTLLPPPRIENEAELVSRRLFFQLLQKEEKTDDQLLNFAEQKNLFERAEKKFGGNLDTIEKESREGVISLQEEMDRIAPDTISLEELKGSPKWDRVVEISQEMADLRQKLVDLSSTRQEIIGGSVESQADTAKQNFIITKCTFVNAQEEGEEQPKWIPVWETVEEFLDEEDRVLVNLARLEYGLFSMGLQNDQDTLDKRFPENRVLREVRRMENPELEQIEPNLQTEIPFDSAKSEE